jgi:predicted SAM-dependent methyltransferase
VNFEMVTQKKDGMVTVKQRIGRWVFPRMPITRFLFEQIRIELNAGQVWLGDTVLPWRRRRIRSLFALRDVRVNVASGPFPLKGFINLDLNKCRPDVIAWDCRWNLPFSDESVAGIRVEHFLEHLETREELPSFLGDCRRVLKPGGVLRIVVPDAERYLQAYCREDLSGFVDLAVPIPFSEDLPTKLDVVNHVFHQWQEHRWAYDFETLAHRLRIAGFSRIERMSYQQSLDSELAQDQEKHAPYSLYVEAVKIAARSSE